MLLSEEKELTPTHLRILFLAFLGWTFDYYDFILYTFLTDPITKDLGVSHEGHALNLALSFGFTAVGGIASGWLSDRFGRRTVVSWTILVYSLGALFSGLAPSPLALSIGRAVIALGVGGEWAAGHTLVAETFPKEKRGRAGALLQAGAPVGVGLALFVATFLAPVVGWRWCFLGSSATALLAFAMRFGMPESDLWEQGKTTRFGSGLGSLVAGRFAARFYLALLLTTMNGASYWLTYSWLPKYLDSKTGTLATPAGYMAVLVLGEVLGYASFGWVSDRLGRRPTFTLYALTMAAGLLPLTVLFESFSTWPQAFYGAMALVGLGTGAWSNFGPMLSELFGTEVRNTALGTVFNLSRFFMVGTQKLILVLEPAYGLAGGIAAAAVFATAASIVVWTLPETRGTSLRHESGE
ncbi:MFS transporter [bacterium]|nr:MFS transporter [bacterium]